MAVIHLAGAVASFLIAGYLLIDSVFSMGLGNVGLLWCLQSSCSNATAGTLLAKFAIGMLLLLFGTWIAYRSRN